MGAVRFFALGSEILLVPRLGGSKLTDTLPIESLESNNIFAARLRKTAPFTSDWCLSGYNLNCKSLHILEHNARGTEHHLPRAHSAFVMLYAYERELFNMSLKHDQPCCRCRWKMLLRLTRASRTRLDRPLGGYRGLSLSRQPRAMSRRLLLARRMVPNQLWHPQEL